MRSLGDIIVMNTDLSDLTTLPRMTLLLNLYDPGYYEPQKRLLLLLGLVQMLLKEADRDAKADKIEDDWLGGG